MLTFITKKRILAVAFLLVADYALGQVSNPTIIPTTVTPTGSCIVGLPWQYTGTGYFCSGSPLGSTGTWAALGSATGSALCTGTASLAYSATPTFDTTKCGVNFTLSGNATPTIAAGQDGEQFCVAFNLTSATQYTITWPTNWQGTYQPGALSGELNHICAHYYNSLSAWVQDSTGVQIPAAQSNITLGLLTGAGAYTYSAGFTGGAVELGVVGQSASPYLNSTAQGLWELLYPAGSGWIRAGGNAASQVSYSSGASLGSEYLLGDASIANFINSVEPLGSLVWTVNPSMNCTTANNSSQCLNTIAGSGNHILTNAAALSAYTTYVTASSIPEMVKVAQDWVTAGGSQSNLYFEPGNEPGSWMNNDIRWQPAEGTYSGGSCSGKIVALLGVTSGALNGTYLFNGTSGPGSGCTPGTYNLVITSQMVPNAGGTGYTVGDTVALTQGGCTGMTASVTSISGGGSTGPVTGLKQAASGTGSCPAATGLATTGGTGTGLTINYNGGTLGSATGTCTVNSGNTFASTCTITAGTSANYPDFWNYDNYADEFAVLKAQAITQFAAATSPSLSAPQWMGPADQNLASAIVPNSMQVDAGHTAPGLSFVGTTGHFYNGTNSAGTDAAGCNFITPAASSNFYNFGYNNVFPPWRTQSALANGGSGAPVRAGETNLTSPNSNNSVKEFCGGLSSIWLYGLMATRNVQNVFPSDDVSLPVQVATPSTGAVTAINGNMYAGVLLKPVFTAGNTLMSSTVANVGAPPYNLVVFSTVSGTAPNYTFHIAIVNMDQNNSRPVTITLPVASVTSATYLELLSSGGPTATGNSITLGGSTIPITGAGGYTPATVSISPSGNTVSTTLAPYSAREIEVVE